MQALHLDSVQNTITAPLPNIPLSVLPSNGSQSHLSASEEEQLSDDRFYVSIILLFTLPFDSSILYRKSYILQIILKTF